MNSGGLILINGTSGFVTRHWEDTDGATDWQDVEYERTKDNQWAR